MKTLELKEFFEIAKYDWTKDKESISEICKFTKTRVKPDKAEFELTWGMEQTFLMKAIAEWMNAETFFEIGTGRGTACYALSLTPSMRKIRTIDIVPHTKKQKTAVNFKPITASNEDLYQMIPYDEKKKIDFLHRSKIKDAYDMLYDLCFIDGDHNNKKIIQEDIQVCQKILTGVSRLTPESNKGVIVFDDYEPRFAVKQVVDDFLKRNPNYKSLLIEFRGHLFPGGVFEKGKGIVLVKENFDLV